MTSQRFVDEPLAPPRCASTCCGTRWMAGSPAALSALIAAHRAKGCELVKR